MPKQLLMNSSEWFCDSIKGEGGATEQKGGEGAEIASL